MFKALEPIIEEPIVSLDPMTAAISLISCDEDVITSQGLKAADIESIQNEQLLEVLYECEKELMAQEAIETLLSEVLDIKIPVVRTDENQNQENKMLSDVQFQKSVRSGCVSSMEWIRGDPIKPNFLDFPGMDFGSVYGMRRAFSEGDIKVSLNYFYVFFYLFTCQVTDMRLLASFLAFVWITISFLKNNPILYLISLAYAPDFRMLEPLQ